MDLQSIATTVSCDRDLEASIVKTRGPDTIRDVYWNYLNFRLYPIDYVSPESIIRYWNESRERLDKFFETEEARNVLQKKVSEQEHFDDEYESYLEKNGAEPRICQCECCQEEKEVFDNLRELPFPFLEPGVDIWASSANASNSSSSVSSDRGSQGYT
ncbi:hypothetical protein VTK56DRAFT_941 [Thermocarpiscus australiensis]